MYSDRRRICLSIFFTQFGNVFDQNETYVWLLSGDLFGELAAPAPEAEVADDEPTAEEAAPVRPVEDDEPEVDDDPEPWPILSVALETALSALSTVLKNNDEAGDITDANGDDGEARAEADTLAAPVGRVWTYTSRNFLRNSTNPSWKIPGGATDDDVPVER